MENGRSAITDHGEHQRRRIIEAAAKLFDEAGYHRTSMGDVAIAAGIAKPTLYHYFRGKSQILLEIHKLFARPILDRQRARADRNLTAREELTEALCDVLSFFAEKPNHMRVFSENLGDVDPENRAAILADRNEYRQLLANTIARGADSGEFKVKDPWVASLVFLGAMMWAYNWLDDNHRNPQELAEIIWEQLECGFAPRAD